MFAASLFIRERCSQFGVVAPSRVGARGVPDCGSDVDPECVCDDAGGHGLDELVDTGVLAPASMDLVCRKMDPDDPFADMQMGCCSREEPIRTSANKGPLSLELADVVAYELGDRRGQSEGRASEGDAHSCLVFGDV